MGPHDIEKPLVTRRVAPEALADVESFVEATAVHASAFFDAEARLVVRRSEGTVARRAACPHGGGAQRIEASASQGDADVRLALLRDEPFEPVDAALAQQVVGHVAATLARAPEVASLTASDLCAALRAAAAEVAAVESAWIDAEPEVSLSLARVRCALAAAASLQATGGGDDERLAVTIVARGVETLAPLAHQCKQRIVFGRMDPAVALGDVSVLGAAVLHALRSALAAGPPTVSVAVERGTGGVRVVVRRVGAQSLRWSARWRAALAAHQLEVGFDAEGEVLADWIWARCE